MTKRASKTTSRTHPAQRSASPRLDPYLIADQAPTLQEIRRVRDALSPVHVVLRDADRQSAA